MNMMPDGRRMILELFARDMVPPAPVPLSRWLAENLVLVDGPRAGELWTAAGAPYLAEIADCLSDDHPANLVTVRKSQQTGVSILALGWALYVAEREPANMLYAVPGIDALRDLNGRKLQPLIDAWQRRTGRTVIVPQTSRSGTGSTTYEKKFAGGTLSLANANSVMDLSSNTTKKGVKDELSKWEDIPGYGDPEDLFFGRFTAFRRTRTHKILEISTPEVDTGDTMGEAAGHCRIDRSFKRSDQRYWNVCCPECGTEFRHRFEHLKIDAERVHKSAYECQACGHLISETERVIAVRAGRYVAEAPGPDRHPGFHVDAFVSLMVGYGEIAEDYLKVKSEQGRKGFSNLVLGLPYRYRGDAPDHKRLMERREDYKRGHVPARGLILVASVDVQMKCLYVEVLAIAPTRESWVVDALMIEGDTARKDSDCFAQLRRDVLERKFPDAFGRLRTIDALGIDAGYRSHVVYSVVRDWQRLHPDTGRDLILALDGRDGWGRPAIGTPKLVDIDLDGQKIKEGARLWPVGTWPLKGAFYADLHQKGIAAGLPIDPPGYCHFGTWQDEEYFKQITAERLEDVTSRGRVTSRRWVPNGDNHFLDCRVYNLALAEYLGLSTMTDDDWAILARRRGMPEEMIEQDLFSRVSEPQSASAEPALPPSNEAPAAPRARGSDDWLGGRGDSW